MSETSRLSYTTHACSAEQSRDLVFLPTTIPRRLMKVHADSCFMRPSGSKHAGFQSPACASVSFGVPLRSTRTCAPTAIRAIDCGQRVERKRGVASHHRILDPGRVLLETNEGAPSTVQPAATSGLTTNVGTESNSIGSKGRP